MREFIRGVMYSIDKGKTWLTNSVLRKLSDASSLYINDSIMLVGTLDNGIYRSNDGGKNWLQTGAFLQRISALTSISGEILAGIARYSTLFPHNFTHRIYKSRNQKYWELNDFQNCTFIPGKTKINSLVVKDRVIFAMFDGNAANCLENTLFVSRDFGITWVLQKKMNVVNDSYVLFQEPYNKKDTLFLTTFNATFNSFFSTDNGASWHTLSRQLTFYDNYVVGKTGNYFCYNRFGNNGELYISKDKATTWQNTQVMDAKLISSLYENDGTVFVSTDKGIYSTQDAINWQSYGSMTATALTVVDNFLYAGKDDGLYKRELLPSSLEEPSSESSIHLYPNPTDETVNIEGTSPGSIVSIYGATGERVLDIEASHSAIDISTLSPGYYTVIIQDQTRRIHSSLCIMR